MVKVYRIPGTDVKIRIEQDDEFWLRLTFDATKDDLMSPKHRAKEIQALGFPTEPIDGGDLEEVTE